MRIAVLCHPTQGGSGIVATELAMQLAGRGHDIHMVSCQRPFRLSEDSSVAFHKVDVCEYPLFAYPPHDLALVNRTVEVAREFDIEIIHAHYAVPHAMCAILASHVVQPHHVKVVATLHGTDITLVGSQPGFRGICTYTMEMSDGLTAVSGWLSDRTVEEFGIARRPDVIHNFVDTCRFNPEGRAPLPSGGSPVEIVHASNFRPVKRITDIIRVFHQISNRIDARLTFVGEGPDEGLARELVAELGLCDRVDFAGSTPHVEEVLRRSHLLLLLSDYESFGLVSLEAMACGTPVAASDSGGIPEVVQDGVTGMLFPVGRPELTAAGCLDLLTDHDRWQRMSSNASRRARECFSSDLIIGEYERYYRALLDGEVWRPPSGDCRTGGALPE